MADPAPRKPRFPAYIPIALALLMVFSCPSILVAVTIGCVSRKLAGGVQDGP